MSAPQLKTSRPSTATTGKVVTVDRITDAHRDFAPFLPAQGYVVAIHDGDRLDIIPQGVVENPMHINSLHAIAAKAAEMHGYAHHLGCPWCNVNNCTDRFDHERLARSAEKTWRVAA